MKKVLLVFVYFFSVLYKRGSCAKFGWDWLRNVDFVKEKPYTHTDTQLLSSSNDVTWSRDHFVYNLNIV